MIINKKFTIIFLILVSISMVSNLYSFSLDIDGNNLIWSPASETKFIYSVYTKSSGKTIWKAYEMENEKESTIYFNDSLIPQWSPDGSDILFTGENAFVMITGEKSREYKISANNLSDFDRSSKGDKVIYSDGEKIYMLEIKKNNNYYVAKGGSPVFIDKDKKILYLDSERRVQLLDESLNSRVVLSNSVKIICPFKEQNKFLYLTGVSIKLHDLAKDISYTLVEDSKEIAGFNVSYDYDFLVYNNNNGEHYIVHIPTMMKVKVTEDKSYFIGKLSFNNKYCAFENEKQIHIKDIDPIISAFNLKNIYKISFGSDDGIARGDDLEIYQEKKNPFNNKITGYEEQHFKGAVKVVAVYNDYCYGMLDKEFSGEEPVEIGDAVLWKAQNKLGMILEK